MEKEIRCNCGNIIKGIVENAITAYKCSDCGAKIISRQDRIRLKEELEQSMRSNPDRNPPKIDEGNRFS